MGQPQTVPIPEVYILWHPRCALGEALAREIMPWLRPGNGLGPEVFYRSLPAPEVQADGLPPGLPGEARTIPSRKLTKKLTNLQLVVALIDANMVADFAWRYWLHELGRMSAQANRIIWPVALDATAYNMPEPIKELNYFRPSGLPLPAAAVEQKSAQFRSVVRSLLKQITEAMCRVMLPRREGFVGAKSQATREPPPKITIFLSHAKQDGTVPARQVRDYIYSQTQLAAFYDENDIAYGSGFARAIEQDLGAMATVAMIAVRSVKYASRPWCRRELSLFRRPRHESPHASGARRWRLFPSLVVEAMQGREFSSGIPELGNTSMIRWTDDDEDLAELVVTTVIRDAMLGSFHSALGSTIPAKRNQIIINWLPDPTTLLHIPAARSDQPRDVFYPGRGLSGLELDILDEFFPNLTFKSFEEALS
jgi:TIR domain